MYTFTFPVTEPATPPPICTSHPVCWRQLSRGEGRVLLWRGLGHDSGGGWDTTDVRISSTCIGCCSISSTCSRCCSISSNISGCSSISSTLSGWWSISSSTLSRYWSISSICSGFGITIPIWCHSIIRTCSRCFSITTTCSVCCCIGSPSSDLYALDAAAPIQ